MQNKEGSTFFVVLASNTNEAVARLLWKDRISNSICKTSIIMALASAVMNGPEAFVRLLLHMDATSQ